MTTRVGDLSSEFRRVSKMQVVQTTRQIILENVRLNEQMSTIETTYNDVEVNNGKLREKVRNLIFFFELDDLTEFLRNVFFSEKTASSRTESP